MLSPPYRLHRGVIISGRGWMLGSPNLANPVIAPAKDASNRESGKGGGLERIAYP